MDSHCLCHPDLTLTTLLCWIASTITAYIQQCYSHQLLSLEKELKPTTLHLFQRERDKVCGNPRSSMTVFHPIYFNYMELGPVFGQPIFVFRYIGARPESENEIFGSRLHLNQNPHPCLTFFTNGDGTITTYAGFTLLTISISARDHIGGNPGSWCHAVVLFSATEENKMD